MQRKEQVKLLDVEEEGIVLSEAMPFPAVLESYHYNAIMESSNCVYPPMLLYNINRLAALGNGLTVFLYCA